MKRAATGLAAVVLTASLCACTIGDKESLPQPTVSEPAPAQPTSEQQSVQTPEQDGETTEIPALLQEAVTRVLSTYGGRAGVAISDGSAEDTAGNADGFASWSTIKVPIAIAALNAHPDVAPQASAAIQSSSNDAAMELWNVVTPEEVETVLAAGQTPVHVQCSTIRPGFSSFGQTQWTVVEQARFAANLRCIEGAAPVVELMGAIVPDQAYGLGTLPSARFKGGWGPSADTGAYEVRQFGLVADTAGRDIAVAIAVQSDNGSYDTAREMASALADEIRPVLDQAPPAPC